MLDIDRKTQVRECWPASPRDWMTTQLAIRLGRLDRYPWFRGLRLGLLSLAGRRGEYVTVNTPFGFRMLVPSADKSLVAIAAGSPAFHPALTRVLQAVLRPGHVFVDGGANFGFYSLLAASILRTMGAIIAFEPDPRNFRLLTENLRLNGYDSFVRAEEIALSNANGEATFHMCVTEGMLSSLIGGGNANFQELAVRTLRLDDYLDSAGIERVDVVKLDLEGGEPFAVEGMPKTLRKTKMLIFEVNEPQLLHLRTNPVEFVNQVAAAGSFSNVWYSDNASEGLHSWDSEAFKRILQRHLYANVFCARNDIQLASFKHDGA